MAIRPDQLDYPLPARHNPCYDIIDGRHRWCAAVMRGAPTELRCDVITATGHALRVLPVNELRIDPEVQIDFAYLDRWARTLASKWNDKYAGVLTVVPLEISRLGLEERAAIKVALDRDRRNVQSIESFLLRVQYGESQACAIKEIAERAGYEIGKLSGGRPYTRLQCVVLLESVATRLELGGLERTLVLNTHWRGDRKSNTGLWLGALSLLVRDGYDEVLTPAAWERWRDVAPDVAIRRAQGEVGRQGNPSPNSMGAVAYEIARELRRCARLRLRQVVNRPGGSHALPL